MSVCVCVCVYVCVFMRVCIPNVTGEVNFELELTNLEVVGSELELLFEECTAAK